MISVLVVEDSDCKRNAYCEILTELKIAEENIAHCKTVNEAKMKLSAKHYDVMILDLVLPRREGDDPEPTGGKELLLEIIEFPDRFQLPDNIFAVSAFDEPMHEIDKCKDKCFFASIKYDITSSLWREQLSRYLSQTIRALETAAHYEYDAAILCALPLPELEQVRRLPFDWRPYKIQGDITEYYLGSYRSTKLVCAASYEMGMPAAAILATKMIQLFHPKYLIMTGIAGCAKADQLHFGDVMIADPCFDYGSGKRVINGEKSYFEPDYRQVRLKASVQQTLQRIIEDQALLKQIKDSFTGLKPKENLSAKMGPFGSGAAVLADASIVHDVKVHVRKLLGFDMEAYAVMLAGTVSSAPSSIPIVIKSVSDFGTAEKGDEFQEYAAYTSAQILPPLFEQLFFTGV